MDFGTNSLKQIKIGMLGGRIQYEVSDLLCKEPYARISVC